LAQGDSRVFSDKDGRRYRCQRSQFIDRGFKRDFVLIDEITEELASSEKATYEKLVRVLAHEVNNTVAATSSVLESLLFYRQQLQQEDREDFSTAIAAVQRRNGNLGEFIERFTRIVKMPEAELQATSLPDILDDMLHLYRQQCSELGIELSLTQSIAVPLQMLDRHLFEQALLNIIKNAIEAVETAQKNANHVPAYVRISLTQDEETQEIKLVITDSARQLSDIPNGQLFTPFFSTKKGGQGIGLMFVREVLNRHGFQHRLAANSQGETEFSIWISPSP
jgi:nitrogen fixation/metabolism regulation signal transduction histidine kinase